MTRRELSQLYYLNREIESLKTRYMALETASTSCTAQISDMPSNRTQESKVEKLGAEMVDISELISLSIKRSEVEVRRLYRYIDDIPSSELRLIFTYRYLNGLSWARISECFGIIGDGDRERKKHDRFMFNKR